MITEKGFRLTIKIDLYMGAMNAIYCDEAILIIENLFWSHRIFTESGSENYG